MGARAHGPFVVLIGESGVGKTTIGELVARHLEGVRLARDDFDYGWRDLYPVLDRSERAVVECVKIPRGLRWRMGEREAVLVELRVNPDTRFERLRQREVDVEDAEMLFQVKPGKNAYEQHIDPDLVLETHADPAEIATQICERVRPLTVGTL